MASVSTYFHHPTAVAGKFSVGGFPINWLTNTKRHPLSHSQCFLSVTRGMVKHS